MNRVRGESPWEREKRHRQGDESQTGLKVLNAGGEAGGVEKGGFTDGRQHEPEHRHQQRLGDFAGSGEWGDRGQAYHHERKVFGGMEEKGNRDESRGESEQEHRADRAAGKGRNRSDGQRFTGLSCLAIG